MKISEINTRVDIIITGLELGDYKEARTHFKNLVRDTKRAGIKNKKINFNLGAGQVINNLNELVRYIKKLFEDLIIASESRNIQIMRNILYSLKGLIPYLKKELLSWPRWEDSPGVKDAATRPIEVEIDRFKGSVFSSLDRHRFTEARNQFRLFVRYVRKKGLPNLRIGIMWRKKPIYNIRQLSKTIDNIFKEIWQDEKDGNLTDVAIWESDAKILKELINYFVDAAKKGFMANQT